MGKSVIIGVAAIVAVAYLVAWEKNHGQHAARLKGAGCQSGAWAYSNTPAYAMTSATNDISVVGVPEESDSPVKICPPSRGGCSGCH